MQKRLVFFLSLLWTGVILSQDIICTARDKEAFYAKQEQLTKLNEQDFGRTLVAAGKTFIGTPYVAKTLEVGERESLVVNLRGLDCTTFVENVLAFSLLSRAERDSFQSFADTLQHIRYRNGKLDGYGSRLHYFTEWIADNEKKGLVEDVTPLLGGQEIQKKINFMSTHRDLYPFLEQERNFQKIVEAENNLNDRPIWVLSQEQVAARESAIKPGDIIALATSIGGLDVTHTGLATLEADGRIHLLHASSSGQVEVSELPLADYLKKIPKNTGIIVARPL